MAELDKLYCHFFQGLSTFSGPNLAQAALSPLTSAHKTLQHDGMTLIGSSSSDQQMACTSAFGVKGQGVLNSLWIWCVL